VHSNCQQYHCDVLPPVGHGGSPALPPVPFASAQPTQINYNGKNQNNQIDPRNGHVIIDHPGVSQSSERQEDKTQQQHDEAVISPLEIMRKEEQERQYYARKENYKKNQYAAHIFTN
jgi:hypothetical protein